MFYMTCTTEWEQIQLLQRKYDAKACNNKLKQVLKSCMKQYLREFNGTN